MHSHYMDVTHAFVCARIMPAPGGPCVSAWSCVTLHTGSGMPVGLHVVRKHACSGGHGQQHGRQRAEEGDARDGRQRLAKGCAGKHEWENEAAAEACACTRCKSAQCVTSMTFCRVSI